MKFLCHLSADDGVLTVVDHRAGTEGWKITAMVGEISGPLYAAPGSAPGVVLSNTGRVVEKDATLGPLGTTEGEWSFNTKGLISLVLHYEGKPYFVGVTLGRDILDADFRVN